MAGRFGKWTDAELGELLRTRGEPARAVAAALGRTPRAVAMKRSELNRRADLFERARTAAGELVLEERHGNWLPVVGFEGLYEVSDLGQVRSVDRVVPCSRNGTRAVRGRRLRQKVFRGYRLVTLSQGNTPVTRRVHALALTAFVGPCPADQEACHNDGDTANNALSNLRWDTSANNSADTVNQGHHPATQRATCPRGHLLVAPNLRRNTLEAGHRGCLACSRAQSCISQQRRHGRPLSDLVKLSDRKYAQIMANA